MVACNFLCTGVYCGGLVSKSRRKDHKKNYQPGHAWLADKIGGILLYAIIYTIIFSVILFFAEKTFLVKPETIAASSVHDYVAPWGPKVINNLGKIIPVFKDLFTQLQGFFGNMGNKFAG